MKRTANVKSLDALRDAKAAVVEFKEVARVALSEATSDVQRTHWWLQNDQLTYWRGEIRRRTERVNNAKSELYRAQLAAMDPRATCFDQKKMLEKAQRELDEAQKKLANVQKWLRQFEREMMLFRGQCQSLSRTVEADLPRGEAKLEHMMDRLEAYLRTIAAPAAPSSGSAPNGPATHEPPRPGEPSS